MLILGDWVLVYQSFIWVWRTKVWRRKKSMDWKVDMRGVWVGWRRVILSLLSCRPFLIPDRETFEGKVRKRERERERERRTKRKWMKTFVMYLDETLRKKKNYSKTMEIGRESEHRMEKCVRCWSEKKKGIEKTKEHRMDRLEFSLSFLFLVFSSPFLSLFSSVLSCILSLCPCDCKASSFSFLQMMMKRIGGRVFSPDRITLSW